MIQLCMVMPMLLMPRVPVAASLSLRLVVAVWFVTMALCLKWLDVLSVLALAMLAPAVLASPAWLPPGMVFHHVLPRWGQPVLAARTSQHLFHRILVGPLGLRALQPVAHRGQHQLLPHLRHQSPVQVPVEALTRAPARTAEQCRHSEGCISVGDPRRGSCRSARRCGAVGGGRCQGWRLHP